MCCINVEWTWWDWSLIFLQCFDTVGWVIWPVKAFSRYDLECVWWDVKPCFNPIQSLWKSFIITAHVTATMHMHRQAYEHRVVAMLTMLHVGFCVCTGRCVCLTTTLYHIHIIICGVLGEVHLELCQPSYRAAVPRISLSHHNFISMSFRAVRTVCRSALRGLNSMDRFAVNLH